MAATTVLVGEPCRYSPLKVMVRQIKLRGFRATRRGIGGKLRQLAPGRGFQSADSFRLEHSKRQIADDQPQEPA